MSHAGYLRSFWKTDDIAFITLVRALRTAGHEVADHAPRAVTQVVMRHVDDANALGHTDRAIVAFVTKLTLWSSGMCDADVAALRDQGLSDHEVHDIVHVAACFAYMNRLADGTGVTLEPTKDALAIELFGKEAHAAHLAWGAR